MTDLTPRQIVAELDKYIIGQDAAKRAVAVAVRNRWRRLEAIKVQPDAKDWLSGKNILMIGPTGVGKTEIARRLAGLTGAPFIKIEATKFTEVGYHGRDVDSMIRDLLDFAINMVRGEMTEGVKPDAEKEVEERLLDLLLPASNVAVEEMEELDAAEEPEVDPSTSTSSKSRTREKLRLQLRAGELEDRPVEISIEERSTVVGVLGQAGMEMDVEFQNMFEKMLPAKRETKRMSLKDARKVLFAQEAEKLIDKAKIIAEAVNRVEQLGIVFLDEIDKIAGTEKSNGPDVSRQGVQRDLLPIVEGTTVMTRNGPVKTDHILFIAAGAFHSSKPSDLMPELQGRFPIRVELQDLTKGDFVRILREPKNALTRQQQALLGAENLKVSFTDEAIDRMAEIAFDVNRRTQNIGARRLYTIMERVFETISFEAPDLKDKNVHITADYVRDRLADVVKDEDLSQFVL